MRIPVSFSLFGRFAGVDAVTQDGAGWFPHRDNTSIGSGQIALPSAGRGAVTVSVPNNIAYNGYILVFNNLRGPDNQSFKSLRYPSNAPAPVFGDLGIVKAVDTAAELSASGLPNFPYTFYRSLDLSPGSWLPIGDSDATAGGIFRLRDPAPLVPRAFYRVEELGVSIFE